MKRLVVWAGVGLLLSAGAAWATDGKQVFETAGCGVCHHAQEQGVGPALAKIAQAYAGKKSDLVAFLEGQRKPVVEPGEFSIMKPNLETTRSLSPKDREALAGFILSHK